MTGRRESRASTSRRSARGGATTASAATECPRAHSSIAARLLLRATRSARPVTLRHRLVPYVAIHTHAERRVAGHAHGLRGARRDARHAGEDSGRHLAQCGGVQRSRSTQRICWRLLDTLSLTERCTHRVRATHGCFRGGCLLSWNGTGAWQLLLSHHSLRSCCTRADCEPGRAAPGSSSLRPLTTSLALQHGYP